MGRSMSMVPVTDAFTDEAGALVREAWLDERAAVPMLPECEVPGDIRMQLAHLLGHGTGVAAFEDGRMVGFLAGFPADTLFGTAAGVYCPVFGHGAVRTDRMRIYRSLYAAAAAVWASEGRSSHAMTVFAHDDTVVQTMFRLGFGMRCIDLIRRSECPADHLHAAGPAPDGLVIRRSVPSDAEALAPFRMKQPAFYSASPIFMPSQKKDPVRDLLSWLEEENRHEWSAWLEGRPVGIMRLSPHAETFVSDHPSVMNIQDTFISEELRGSGIGLRLLDAVQTWLRENGYPLCGVDCESINPSGSDFWLKHFTPYTWSLTRRLDERSLVT